MKKCVNDSRLNEKEIKGIKRLRIIKRLVHIIFIMAASIGFIPFLIEKISGYASLPLFYFDFLNIIFLILFVGGIISLLLATFSKCPRCDKLFFTVFFFVSGSFFVNKCLHCGLSLKADERSRAG